ncbi:GGDEF domain-containing protein [bacterium]|nr:GGDEF domain-containing protein [bacterium]
MDIPSEVLDEIQKNIEDIIRNFDVPDANKMDVIKKINFIYNQSKHLSITDELTGLFNRRHFEQNFEREFLRAKRYGSDLSIAIIDIDFFKKVNDTYGHLCGDYVLRETAYTIQDSFRKTDMVFRYGGEEFVVILTETSLESALIPLERLRKRIEAKNLFYEGKNFNITVSIGLNSDTSKFESASEFLDAADKALYRAKENGRNRIETH